MFPIAFFQDNFNHLSRQSVHQPLEFDVLGWVDTDRAVQGDLPCEIDALSLAQIQLVGNVGEPSARGPDDDDLEQGVFLGTWLWTHTLTMSRDVADIHGDRADFATSGEEVQCHFL